MSHGPEIGAAVTSPWPTLWAPGPAAQRGESESLSGGRCSGTAAVTVSPWATLWAGESEPQSGEGRSRHS